MISDVEHTLNSAQNPLGTSICLGLRAANLTEQSFQTPLALHEQQAPPADVVLKKELQGNCTVLTMTD